MNKAIKFGCMLMMLVGGNSLVAAPLGDQEHLNHYVINLLSVNEQVLRDFMEGKMPTYIIECSEGSSLPFNILIEGEFLALDSGDFPEAQVKILKTCYVRCEGPEEFLFSTDLTTWKSFLEFFTGELGVSTQIVDNGKPVASLWLKLNQRRG